MSLLKNHKKSKRSVDFVVREQQLGFGLGNATSPVWGSMLSGMFERVANTPLSTRHGFDEPDHYTQLIAVQLCDSLLLNKWNTHTVLHEDFPRWWHCSGGVFCLGSTGVTVNSSGDLSVSKRLMCNSKIEWNWNSF